MTVVFLAISASSRSTSSAQHVTSIAWLNPSPGLFEVSVQNGAEEPA